MDLADGSITAHLEYDAFGRTIASTGIAPASFGFSTKYQDEESGYYYYGFRYYDLDTGRWLNRDPIEEQGGNNLYGFVGNNGVFRLDYLGLKVIWSIDEAETILPPGLRLTDPDDRMGRPKGDFASFPAQNMFLQQKAKKTWKKWVNREAGSKMLQDFAICIDESDGDEFTLNWRITHRITGHGDTRTGNWLDPIRGEEGWRANPGRPLIVNLNSMSILNDRGIHNETLLSITMVHELFHVAEAMYRASTTNRKDDSGRGIERGRKCPCVETDFAREVRRWNRMTGGRDSDSVMFTRRSVRSFYNTNNIPDEAIFTGNGRSDEFLALPTFFAVGHLFHDGVNAERFEVLDAHVF